ncbi:hypothetical protein PYW07_007578 [Mythimna separata]|uniref:Carboxylesterase type B domain-containing protein n=1 Tax=Mythimna separata TaxID=271217 RepID=A0AAD7YQH2_MYTSE|nr:hypothetical protein PYW07_007578 [Mythimna separata]
MRLGGVGVVCRVSVVLCVVQARPTPAPRPHRDVATSQGAARGYLAPDSPHFAYFGLPYARPPTRRDRFKAPEPPPEWDGVFEATHKIKCSQANADGEENCLVVNVFTPEDATSLPVLVFVHGGDFQNGGADHNDVGGRLPVNDVDTFEPKVKDPSVFRWGAYQAPNPFLEDGYVIVTFNYRLGALGFLSLGIPEAPGNAGLKDQIAALYWVHRNIAEFGGNPADVTVYGTGAGAAAVQLVLMSGLVEGLLHRVILESRSALSPSAMMLDPLNIAYNGAVFLGYEGTNSPDELYSFYEQASAEDLASIPEMFLPCIDHTSDNALNLIDVDPIKNLKDGNFYNVPMLITFTHPDKTSIIGPDTEKFETAPENFDDLLPNNLEFEEHKDKHGLGEIVKQFYFKEDFREDMVQNYADYMHDILTEYPIFKMAMLFAAKNKYSVYLMKFTLPRQGSDESMTSFDAILDYLYKEEEQTEDVLEKLMTLLKNFIQMGDPTPLTTSLIPVIWQPVPSGKENFQISDVPLLQFDRTLRMSVPPSNQRLLFWDNIYSQFYKPHVIQHEETEDLDEVSSEYSTSHF